MALRGLTRAGLGGPWAWGQIPVLVIVALLLAAPAILSGSNVALLTEILIWALFAISYNLLLGYTGVVSLGHAAFFGIGGYAVALILVKTGVPFVIAFAAAPVAAAAAALVMGILALRLTAIYFALFTLAVGQIAWSVSQKWVSFTGGDNGLGGFASSIPNLISSRQEFYFFTLSVVAVATGILFLVVNSPFGFTLRAIRENRNRAEFMGIPVRRYQLLAFVISGLFAGLAGALLVTQFRFVHPENLFWLRSAEVLLMALLGGVHLFWGPALGAGVFIYLDDQVRAHPYDNLALTGLALGGLALVVVVLLPFGLGGLIQFVGRVTGAVRRADAALPPDRHPWALRWRTALTTVGQNLGIGITRSGKRDDSES